MLFRFSRYAVDEGFSEKIEDGLAATNFGAIGGGGSSSGGVAVAQRGGEIVTRKPGMEKGSDERIAAADGGFRFDLERIGLEDAIGAGHDCALGTPGNHDGGMGVVTGVKGFV